MIINFPARFKCRFIYGREINKYRDCKQLVIFFIPGTQAVTGGVLQIFTLHRLTQEYFKNTDFESLICWLPGEGWGGCHFNGFNNDVVVYALEDVLKNCCTECRVIFQIPEYSVSRFFDHIGWKRMKVMKSKYRLHINVLNQNIQSMPGRDLLSRIKKIFPELTCTAGHPDWASAKEKARLDVPIYFVPTWYYPDDAPWQSYDTKKNIMIVSPDYNPNTGRILDVIRNAFPYVDIRIIKNLKYEEYLEIERAAKWSITFGEGLDGYFYGPVLRGGVSFAVRNNTFDVDGLESVLTIYPDYDSMAKNIVNDMNNLNSKSAYEAFNNKIRPAVLGALGRDTISKSLVDFYITINLNK